MVAHDEFPTLAHALRRWGAEAPETVAFQQIDRRLATTDLATWGELNAQARAVAGALLSAGTMPGERVLVAARDPLPYVRAILGCFWAGAIAVPLPHGRGRRSAEMLALARRLCAPRFGLHQLGPTPESADGGRLSWIAVDALSVRQEPGPSEPLCGQSDIALIQFSSGSTAVPKGATLLHGGLVANEAAIALAFGHDRKSHILCWLPLNHDMGLVGNVLQTVYLGGSCMLLPSREFSADPLAWIRAISAFQVTTSGGPDSAYALVCDLAPQLTEASNADLNLGAWRRAYSGAEPVRAATLRRFAHTFDRYGFDPHAQINCYGLAEASLLVTSGPARDAAGALPAEGEIDCGTPGLGIVVRIVDPDSGRALPDGEEGEIWVAGPSLAHSYWGDSKATRRNLRAQLAGESDGTRFLRTGDLGRLHQGRLVVGGRLDDRLSYFGRNIHAHEVEATAARAVAGLRADKVVAFPVDCAGTAGLALVVEPPAGMPPAHVRDVITDAVRETFDVPVAEVAFARTGQIPRTTSGKPRRRACARQLQDGRFRRVPLDSLDDEAHWPARLVSEALGRRVVEADLRCSLRGIGGDSLAAARLSALLARRRGLAVSPARLLTDGTLAEALAEATPSGSGDSPVDTLPSGRLTSLQRRLLAQSELDGGCGASNVAWAAWIDGNVDPRAFGAAWARLADSHEALRASFIAADPAFAIAAPGGEAAQPCIVHAEDWTEARLLQDMWRQRARPFAAGERLVRAALYRLAAGRGALLICGHHAVCDLASLRRLVSELLSPVPPLGAAPCLSALGSVAQPAEPGSDGGEAVAIDLPTDRPAPRLPDFHGAEVSLRLSATTIRRLSQLAARVGASPAEAFLALWALVLMRLGDADAAEIAVSVDVRPAHGLDGAIGCGIAMSAVRLTLAADTTMRALIGVTASQMRQALCGCAATPLEPRDGAGPAARLDASFLWLDRFDAELLGFSPRRRDARPFWGGKLGVTVFRLPVHAVQHALALTVAMDTEGGAVLALDYAAARFQPETALAPLRALAAGLGALDSPDQLAAALPLLDPVDAALVARWSRGPLRDHPETTLAARVDEAARRVPDAVAIVDATCPVMDGAPLPAEIDYAMIARLSDGLAARLLVEGVRPGMIVGLALPRSSLAILAMLAAMKAGAIFAPLNPADPPARRAAMVEDLGCALTLAAGAQAGGRRILDLAAPDLLRAPVRAHGPAPGEVAYAMFTSGSTGRPKAVLIEHRAIVCRILSMAEELAVQTSDIVLHKSPTTFDVSLWEIFLPLASGARVLVAEPGSERDPDRISSLIRTDGITIVHFVPSMLSAFLADRSEELTGAGLRHVVCSGEPLSPAVRDAAIAAFGERVALWNYYGPTEAAIDVARHRACAGEPISPIGLPTANTNLHVRDRWGGLAPIGARGEIWISGTQVGRGYLNRPEITEEVFQMISGERFYRTGDLGRWTGAGVLEHLGRRDDQWKIRGQRVERGEIEAVLRELDGIADAAVTLVRTADGAAHLEAHVSAVDPAAPPSPGALRAAVAALLPAVMVPAHVAVGGPLPVSASGKLDRARLPVLANALARPWAQAEPASQLERRLCEVLAVALGRAAVAPDQSFFDLGGDSLRAIRAVAEARACGLTVSMALLYEAPTARALASKLANVGVTRDMAPASPPSIATDATNGEGDGIAFPLSSAQSALLFLSESEPDYEVYVTSLRLQGRFDGTALHVALQACVDRHAFLRIVYDPLAAPEPLQRALPRAQAALAAHDLRTLTAGERVAAIEAFINSERRRPFDWTCAPMLRASAHRLTEDQFQITLSYPTLDGWCTATLLAELVETYSLLLEGAPIDTGSAPALHRTFVRLEREAATSPVTQAYWRRVLGRAAEGLASHARSNGASRRVARRRVEKFAGDIRDRLERIARLAGTNLRSVLLAAHASALWRLRGRRGGLVFVETTGRPEVAGGDAALGLYNNIVPIEIAHGRDSWLKLVAAAHAGELAMLPHRRFPYTSLRALAGGSVADAVFVYTDFRPYRRLLNGPVTLLDIIATDQTYLPLTAHFTLDPLGPGLWLIVDYDAAAYDEVEVGGYIEAVRAAVSALTSRPYDAFDIAPPPPPPPLWSEPLSLVAAFGAQARRAPDAVAVEQGSSQLSYSALDIASGSVAGALRRRGLGPESIVALDLNWGPALLIGVLGCLKSGAAFLPLDRSAPPARRAGILATVRPAIILSDQCSGLDGVVAPGLAFADAIAAPPEGGRNDWPDTLAYVLYTSGSTGRPKGIAVGRHALSAYVEWAARAYAFDRGRGAGLVTAADVDLTLTALLCPLVRGARVTFATAPGCIADLKAFAGDPDLGVLKLTPSHLDALAAAWEPISPQRWPAELVLGGEDVAPRHGALLGDLDCDVINEYGPTEATVGCMASRLTPAQRRAGRADLGEAIGGTRIDLVDALGQVPLDGLPGEIAVAGPQLARGYLDDPARTATAFRPDPAGHGRLYHTGDLAVRTSQGALRFVGRADRQAKVCGRRVELGEVEAILLARADVAAAICMMIEGPDGRVVLGACVACRAGTQLDPRQLRADLAKEVPDALVPSRIVVTDTIPLTPAGKTDLGRIAELLRAPEPDGLEALLGRIEAMTDAEAEAMLTARRSPTERIQW